MISYHVELICKLGHRLCCGDMTRAGSLQNPEFPYLWWWHTDWLLPAVHTCHEWSMPARSTQISNIPQHAWCKTLMASVVRLYLCGRKRPYHWQSYRVTSNAKRQFWLYGRRIELFVANAQEKQLSWVQFYLKITTTEMSGDVTWCKANIDSYMMKQRSVHERTWHTIDLRCESMGPITPLKILL